PRKEGIVLSEYALKLSAPELARYRFMAESAARMERELWAASGITQGAVVADVGCGPGAVSVVLAGLVGPGGRVLAVDRDAETVETARAVVAQAGTDNVSVAVGEAHDSGIAPGSVDVVMIRHVLGHNRDLEEAIVAHAATLVRPGGAVYLTEGYPKGAAVRPSDPDLEALTARYVEWHHRRGNDLDAGLRLAELLRSAGLDTVDHQGRYNIFTPTPGFRPPSWAARDALVAAGLATSDDVERWRLALERLDAVAERVTVFVPLFFAFGRRPTS
ncbi:MAG TPA: methyltransferase domain-containing protein, partial [Acidimicrobiales bacterium]|nr:methyltransferase domain-containing protein [Acidimicrobiales bacterium]